jgi:excisionase family DNA binding protein
METQNSNWLSVAEAVAYSKLSRSTLYVLLKKNNLRARKVGARTLLSRLEIDSLIEGHAP